jgi:hypothetical protein
MKSVWLLLAEKEKKHSRITSTRVHHLYHSKQRQPSRIHPLSVSLPLFVRFLSHLRVGLTFRPTFVRAETTDFRDLPLMNSLALAWLIISQLAGNGGNFVRHMAVACARATSGDAPMITMPRVITYISAYYLHKYTWRRGRSVLKPTSARWLRVRGARPRN